MRKRQQTSRIIGIVFTLFIVCISLLPIDIVSTSSSSNSPDIQYRVAQALAGYGTITVTSDPPGQPFTLYREGKYYYGGLTTWSVDNAICEVTYSIVWCNMPGYITPLPEAKPLPYEGSITFHGIYKPGQETNKIDINSSPLGAAFTLIGPTSYNKTTPWQASNIPVGTYTLTWKPMPGHLTPSPETVTIEEGVTCGKYIIYQPLPDSGYISVTSNLAGASFSLIGPDNYSHTVPFNSSAPVGSYTINWNEISGYTKPPSTTHTVAKDSVTSIYGEYTTAGQPVKYALSINTNGQGTASPAAGISRYSPGTQVSITASASPGWEFAYWGGDASASGNNPSTTVIMNSDKTVIAYFRQISTPKYGLSTTVNPVGSGYISLSPQSTTYAATTPVIVTAHPNTGWEFDRWGVDATGTSIQTTVIMNSNKNITAYFKRSEAPPERYDITTYVEPAGSGTVSLSPSGGSYDQGTQVTLTANANPGWTFAYWGGAAQGTSTSTPIIMSSNRSVTANFQQIEIQAPQTGTINVNSNLIGVSFNIMGPKNYSGTTPSWSVGNAPAGSYTITWNLKDGYITPQPETMNLPQGGSATFYGNYQQATPLPGSTLKIPDTIRVLRVSTGQIQEIDFKSYVKNVLPNEWYASWDMNALKAGAMAVKTYAWYWCINQKYSGQGYDVRDDASDQVYKPGTSHVRTDQAVDETWNWIMTRQGAIFQAQYVDGTPGSPDPISAQNGKTYPGRMSQWGTKYLAESGKDWQSILHYYYDPVEIVLPGSSNIGPSPETIAPGESPKSIPEMIKGAVNNILNFLGFNAPAPAGNLSDKVVELAKSQIGNKRGDEDGDQRFKDRIWYDIATGTSRCQAFVNAVILVARYDRFISGCSYYDAYQAYENYKNVLDSDPIQRGDIVFYGNVDDNGQVGGPGHVAIYDGTVPGKEVISVWLPDQSVQRHALDPQGTPKLKRLGWMSPDKYNDHNAHSNCCLK